MRLIFAGTPQFAATALNAIIRAGHTVLLVLTQPDRPAGRGMKSVPSAVKQTAITKQLELLQPSSLKSEVVYEKLRINADAMIVAAYGLILPKIILDMPKHGCINIHASLLPRWRGAAPIQRAILAGDAVSGISIMQMDSDLDTGSIIMQKEIPIAANDTAGLLHNKLADLGAELIITVLDQLEKGKLSSTPQSPVGITYAEKISKSEAELNWHHSAVLLERQIRAFNPNPGLHAIFRGEKLKIWQATLPMEKNVNDAPGTVLDITAESIIVACGKGILALKEVQKSGGKKLLVNEFLRGFKIQKGERFELPSITNLS